MNRGKEAAGEQNRITRQQLLGEAWWTSEFLGMMRPGDHNQQQVARGRRLAERGQVVIRALHVGSADSVVFEPAGGIRNVTLWVMDLDDEWEIVYRIFAENQVLFTRLLNGDYAEELDDLLRGAGISVIPETAMDLDFRCDCISDTHICSHIIASYLALGKYINDNPVLLFQLRGRSREEIIAGVDSYRDEGSDRDGQEVVYDSFQEIHQDMEEYDPPDPVRYYDTGPQFEKIRFLSAIPEGKESDLFRLLGPSGIRLGKRDLAEIIGETYPKAAQYGKRFMNSGSDDNTLNDPEKGQRDTDVSGKAKIPGPQN